MRSGLPKIQVLYLVLQNESQHVDLVTVTQLVAHSSIRGVEMNVIEAVVGKMTERAIGSTGTKTLPMQPTLAFTERRVSYTPS